MRYGLQQSTLGVFLCIPTAIVQCLVQQHDHAAADTQIMASPVRPALVACAAVHRCFSSAISNSLPRSSSPRNTRRWLAACLLRSQSASDRWSASSIRFLQSALQHLFARVPSSHRQPQKSAFKGLKICGTTPFMAVFTENCPPQLHTGVRRWQ